MPPVTPQSTLGDLVTADPSLARQLERHGLDYCCGGTRTIAEACASQRLDVDALIAELTTDTDPPCRTGQPWPPTTSSTTSKRPTTATCGRSSPALSALIDKVTSVHGARHPELDAVARCYDALRADLEPHLVKEERVLFPMIRELATARRETDVPLRFAAQPHLGDGT